MQLSSAEISLILFTIAYTVLSLLALIDVLKSKAKPILKLIWVLSFFFAPFGFLFYYFIGKKQLNAEEEPNT